jgi:hypothetical protein
VQLFHKESQGIEGICHRDDMRYVARTRELGRGRKQRKRAYL